MSRRRIFFFNRFFWPDQSATAQILTDLCRSLDGDDYEITVVSSRLDYDNNSVRYRNFEMMGNVRIDRLWSTRYGRANLLGRLSDYLTIYVSIFFYLLRNLDQRDVAVMKTDPPLLGIIGAVAKTLKGLHLVSWCQDIFPEVAVAEIRMSPVGKLACRLLERMRDWSLKRSNRVVVLGKDMSQYLTSRKIDPGKVFCISNWSVQADEKSTQEQQLRESWGISRETFVVGYSGNLGRAHDWQTILDCAIQLKDETNLLFLMCGGGFGYNKLKDAVSEKGLQDMFRFLDYQPRDKLSSSLRVPDLHWLTLKTRLTPFIYPSKFFGILQAGRPVLFIGNPDCEIAELIRDNGIGNVVEAGDSTKCLRAIESMKSDNQAVVSAGMKARKLWENRYRKDIEIDKWRSLLSGI